MTPKTLALGSVALIVIGCVLAAVGTAVALDVIAIIIAGVGLVGLISAAFLAIGLSEDRARERDANDPSR